MKRVSKEIERIAAGLQPYVEFRIVGVDPKKADFASKIVCDLEEMADLIRRNEGMEMELTVRSGGGDVAVDLAMSEHKARSAIVKKIRKTVDKGAKKRGLTVRYGGLGRRKGGTMDKTAVAMELVRVAELLSARDFPSKGAMDKYLKEHPGADRSNHRVVKKDDRGPNPMSQGEPWTVPSRPMRLPKKWSPMTMGEPW